jgi:hypothetical protein
MKNQSPPAGDYIFQMVQETFEGVADSSSADILEFKRPDDPQLNFSFDSIDGVYDQKRKCLIFDIGDQILEFPQNWSLFGGKDLSHISEGDVLFVINEGSDTFKLLSVLGELLGSELASVECKVLNSRPFLVVQETSQQLKAA